MALTPINKIYGTDDTSPGDWQAESQAQAGSIEDAFTRRLGTTWHNFVFPTSTERNAQAGMLAGDLGYQVDIGAEFRYTGNGWTQLPRVVTVSAMAGLAGIVAPVNGDQAFCSGDGALYVYRNASWRLPYFALSKLEQLGSGTASGTTNMGRTFPSNMIFTAQNGDAGANGATIYAAGQGNGDTSGNVVIAWKDSTGLTARVNYVGTATM